MNLARLLTLARHLFGPPPTSRLLALSELRYWLNRCQRDALAIGEAEAAMHVSAALDIVDDALKSEALR